jgi:hypothetical protein
MQAARPGVQLSLSLGVKVNHLVSCMHTGIRSPSANNLDTFARNITQCPLNMVLNTIAVRLALPAIEGCTVIRQNERDASHIVQLENKRK